MNRTPTTLLLSALAFLPCASALAGPKTLVNTAPPSRPTLQPPLQTRPLPSSGPLDGGQPPPRAAALKPVGGQAPDAGIVGEAHARSAPVPSAGEAKKVIEYYYTGKAQGPVLAELKACLQVDSGKDSLSKNECLEIVKGPVKKGSLVHLWTLWLVPEGGSYDDVTLQFVHEGQPRTSVDIALSGSLRSRTWRSQELTKPGVWTLKVLRRGAELGSTNVTVSP